MTKHAMEAKKGRIINRRTKDRGSHTSSTTIQPDVFAKPWEDEDQRAVHPYRPFPIDALPEPISAFVAEAARAIGCDESYVALPLLASVAAAIGNTRRIQLKRGGPSRPLSGRRPSGTQAR